jgi:hypothetical protein
MKPMKTKKLYYVQNLKAGYLGNSPVFYGKGGVGYTQWLDDAMQFTWEEFRQLCRSTRGTHKWQLWSVKSVDAVAQRTVDIQRLQKPARAKQAAQEQADGR